MYGIVNLAASILGIYVTWQGSNFKLLEDDIQMSKHVGLYIIQKETVVIYIYIYAVVILTVYLFVVIKTLNNARYMHQNSP